MWQRIRASFVSGIEKLKWFSSIFSERMKVELSVISLSAEREKREKDRMEKMRVIGERVLELRKSADKNILKDEIVMQAVSEAEKIDADIEDLKKKISEISKIEYNDK